MENKLDRDYQAIMFDLIENGVKKDDRTGTGTVSLFGKEIRHDMKTGFPLLTTKKMAFKTMVTELLWFLRGDTNIKYLVDNGCNIWNGDCYSNYIKNWKPENKNVGGDYINQKLEDERPLPRDVFIHLIKTDDEFAKKWGELGPIYGAQWRGWNQGRWERDYVNPIKIDQIQNLINDLKTNPDSRRLMVNAWNVAELDSMALPPCHYGFQVYTRKLTINERMDEFERRGFIKNIDPLDWVPERAISLIWNQRSADYFLGVPFNISSYGLLLTILGKMTNMLPDELIGRFGDTHLYSNHLTQARQQIPREPYQLPGITINKEDDFWKQDLNVILDNLSKDDFQLVNYESHPSIKAPLSN